MKKLIGALFLSMSLVAAGFAAEKLSEKQITQQYHALESAVRENAVKKALEIAIPLLQNDLSNYAAEVIYPLYKKRTAEFKKIMNSMPQEDQRLLLESIKVYEKELENGNG